MWLSISHPENVFIEIYLACSVASSLSNPFNIEYITATFPSMETALKNAFSDLVTSPVKLSVYRRVITQPSVPVSDDC